MKNNQQPLRFVIRINENPVGNACPNCGTQTNPNIGCEIFLENSDLVVCLDCSMLHAPLLAALVNMADLARDFVGNEQVPALVNLADAARIFIGQENELGNQWERNRRVEARKHKGVLITFPQERRQTA